MSYLSDFERSFSEHTLAVVRGYKGPFEATLLVNCLLGLLVVPNETALQAVPEDPLPSLSHWGIDPMSIKNPGKPTRTNPNPATLRGLVVNLRHSVAHFRIKPVPATDNVHSFEFQNDVHFHAVISLADLRRFVERLSEHLAKQ